MLKQFARNNKLKIILLAVISLLMVMFYMFYDVNPKFFDYAMSIRTPKTIAMIIAAFCIGGASIIFQSVINNRIVTPCLLGMNSLYILIHTCLVFILGSTHQFVANQNIAFIIDLIIMSLMATVIYGFLFKKTKYNVLYVLLAGSVIATLFTSITNTMMRMIDPNEFTNLQETLIAGFGNINAELLIISTILISASFIIFAKELKLLNVITLGKNMSINLGVNYDKTITKLLLLTTLLITIATALVGPISFLGLIIANIGREYFKTFKHFYLIIGSFLFGIIILFLGQSMIEHIFAYNAVISVFINLFGGGYFLYLIVSNKGA